MATYTMPLKTIIEQPTQYRDDLTLKQRLEVGRVNLFKDMDYPIFNENYRSEFESKFIRYFYNKEIGFETESLFKFELETWLQINMPYYNQLFESELLEYDPLTNIAMQFDQDLKQDTSLDTTKDSQEDSTSNSVTQSSFEHDTQRNTKTDTTTDITGHSETDTLQDSNTTSTTNTTSDSNTHTESNTTQDAFNRKIDSDTPDNRLHLSSNEGSGVIEYANNIAETMDKSTGDTTTDTNTTDTSNSITNTTDKTTSNSETDTSENTISNSVTDDTTKQTGWDNSETNAKGQIIGNIVGRDVGNKLENLYNERYGKDGSITYQQMIQELRATFLRIERQIFREMTELFMLLY